MLVGVAVVEGGGAAPATSPKKMPRPLVPMYTLSTVEANYFIPRE